jgi:hypothetical protein
MGSIGSPGFELLHAQNAFYQLVVQKEGRHIPDLQAAYPGVTFRNKNEWEPTNTELADGMNQLISMLKEKKDDIRRQRVERGVEEKFSQLTSKELPSR